MSTKQSPRKLTLAMIKGKPITTSVPVIHYHASDDELEEIYPSTDEERRMMRETQGVSSNAPSTLPKSSLGSDRSGNNSEVRSLSTENIPLEGTPPSLDPWKVFSEIKGKITKTFEEKLSEIKSDKGKRRHSKGESSSISDTDDPGCRTSIGDTSEANKHVNEASIAAARQRGNPARYVAFSGVTTGLKDKTLQDDSVESGVEASEFPQDITDDTIVHTPKDRLPCAQTSDSNNYTTIPQEQSNSYSTTFSCRTSFKAMLSCSFKQLIIQSTCKSVAALIAISCILHVIPVPDYLLGFTMGVLATFTIYNIVIKFKNILTTLPDERCMSSRTIPVLEIPAVEEHAAVERFQGWLNELPYSYQPNNYHVARTKSVFFRLEGHILRIMETRMKVPKRAVWDEPKHKVKFVKRRVYDLTGARIELVPRGLTRRRRWSKKYPICITLKKEALISNVALKSSTNFDTCRRGIAPEGRVRYKSDGKSLKGWVKETRSCGEVRLVDSGNERTVIKREGKIGDCEEDEEKEEEKEEEEEEEEDGEEEEEGEEEGEEVEVEVEVEEEEEEDKKKEDYDDDEDEAVDEDEDEDEESEGTEECTGIAGEKEEENKVVRATKRNPRNAYDLTNEKRKEVANGTKIHRKSIVTKWNKKNKTCEVLGKHSGRKDKRLGRKGNEGKEKNELVDGLCVNDHAGDEVEEEEEELEEEEDEEVEEEDDNGDVEDEEEFEEEMMEAIGLEEKERMKRHEGKKEHKEEKKWRVTKEKMRMGDGANHGTNGNKGFDNKLGRGRKRGRTKNNVSQSKNLKNIFKSSLNNVGQRNELKIFVFGRADREKEDWYRRLVSATSRRCIKKHDSLQFAVDATFNVSRTQSTIQKPINPEAKSPFSVCNSHDAVPELNYNAYMTKLLDSDLPVSSESNLAGLWINCITARILFDVCKCPETKSFIQDKIQRKLSNIKLPYFMECLLVSEIVIGQGAPVIRNATKPVLNERGLWLDFDITYTGSLTMIVETKLNLMKLTRTGPVSGHSEKHGETSPEKHELATRSPIFDSDLEDTPETSTEDDYDTTRAQSYNVTKETTSTPSSGRKFLSMVDRIAANKYFQHATELSYVRRAMEGVSNTEIRLMVTVSSVEGCLSVNIPPAPSDRLWYGFKPVPKVNLIVKPAVGERTVNIVYITKWIEAKLLREFEKLVVLPNMDDLVMPLCPNYPCCDDTVVAEQA